MEIAPELLEILACPKCKGSVRLDEDKAGFVCDSCALLYPIEDGIPDFLPEDAKPLQPAESEG